MEDCLFQIVNMELDVFLCFEPYLSNKICDFFFFYIEIQNEWKYYFHIYIKQLLLLDACFIFYNNVYILYLPIF